MPRRAVRASSRKKKVTITGTGAYRRRAVTGHGAYRRVRGHGAYDLSNGPWANIGDRVGQDIGGHFGMGKLGGWLGRRAFHYPAKLFGSGSYEQVNDLPRTDNSLLSNLAPPMPQFSNNKDYVVISHREYLGDVITSGTAGAISINKYGLNPSDVNSFPWLSSIAQPNFQQYKFEGLIFEFRTFSADALNSTNTALGAVFAAINYDYTSVDLASRSQIENTDWAMSVKPSESMAIPVECETQQTGLNGGLLYVVNGNDVPRNSDPKTYYLGKLFVGTTGFQGSNVNVGSLYVTYKIRLYKPVQTAPLSNALISTLARETNVSLTYMFGDSTAKSPYNCDSVGIQSINGNVMYLSTARMQIGQVWSMTYNLLGLTGTGVCVGAPYQIILSPAFTGLSYQTNSSVRPYTSPGDPTFYDDGNATYVNCTIYFIVVDTNQAASITINPTGLTVMPSNPAVQFVLTQICGMPLQTIGSSPYTGIDIVVN